MTNYLLDTNHCSHLVNFGHPLRAKILASVLSGDKYWVSTANISEIVYGFATSTRSIENLARWDALSREIGVLVLQADESALAGHLQAKLRKIGLQLKTVDAQLAVQALRNNLVVLTTDSDFVTVPGLANENWL